MARTGNIGFELQGVQEVLNHFYSVRNLKQKQVERGLRKSGQWLLKRTKEVVPVDTGRLKKSGKTRTTGKGFNMIVWVEYRTPYAIYVHERLDLRHKPGKIAKFVETPMRQYRLEIAAILRKELSMRQ